MSDGEQPPLTFGKHQKRERLLPVRSTALFGGIITTDKNMNEDQPRVPAGSPEGGQWTGGNVIHQSHTPIEKFDTTHVRSDQIAGVYFSKPGAPTWDSRRQYTQVVDISTAKLASPEHAKSVYLDEMGKSRDYGKRASERLAKEGYHGADLGKNEVVVWDTSKAKIVERKRNF